MEIQQLISGGLGVSLVSAVARVLPARLGYPLADFVAGCIASNPRSRMVQAVRANQWVIRGEPKAKEFLDRAVFETFSNSARCIFDLYHFINNPRTLDEKIVFNANVQHLIHRPEFEARGLIVAGLHISDFDLVLRVLTQRGMRGIILTIPDPKGSQRVEFEMRKKTGMNLVIPSFGILRQAIRHLQKGGMVLTGIDRPIPKPKVRPRFFGRPSGLPVHHITMALVAKVPVMVLATIRLSDGKSHVITSDPIEMQTGPDTNTETINNAEKVLAVAEDFIRKAPTRWAITLPVWPETLGQPIFQKPGR